MRKRTYGINVRVSKEEKERLERMARRCGISLSAYLRKVGVGEDLSAQHPLECFSIVHQEVSHGNHQDQTGEG